MIKKSYIMQIVQKKVFTSIILTLKKNFQVYIVIYYKTSIVIFLIEKSKNTILFIFYHSILLTRKQYVFSRSIFCIHVFKILMIYERAQYIFDIYIIQYNTTILYFKIYYKLILCFIYKRVNMSHEMKEKYAFLTNKCIEHIY